MAKKPCLDCGQLSTGSRCPTHQRVRDNSTTRGYGTPHRQHRTTHLPQAYGTPCTRCGDLMHEHQQLHLDHNDDRDGYRGFSHAHCNVGASAHNRTR